jgi:RimJ/RimL family protein N-acetyltransferase
VSAGSNTAVGAAAVSTTEGFWLATSRLLLRRFTPGDAAWFAGLYADPEVTRYLGGTKTRAQADELFRSRVLEYYDACPGFGIWMTVDKATRTGVGFHLLNNVQGESFVQVGFTLARRAWGKGYGTEMAAAVLGYGFTVLQLPRIVGIANLPNLASQQVLTKIGLRRNGERAFAHPAYAAEGPMAWFECDRDEWLADRMPAAADLFALL